MAIANIVGFDDLARLNLSNLTDFSPMGKIPFKTLMDNQDSSVQHSYFRMTNHDSRGWLTTQPKYSDRRPESYCYCYRSSSSYYYWRCYDRARRHSTGLTNNKRRRDSSMRSPVLGVDFQEVFPEHLYNPDVDVFRFGTRVYLPTGSLEVNNTTNTFMSLVLIRNSDKRDYYTTNRHTLFSKTEINGALNWNKAYVEVEVNRRTGLVRRWIDSVEYSSSVLSADRLANFNDLRVQYGDKSRSVEGEDYRWHRSGNSSCPNSQTYTGGYDYDGGAPQNQDFGLTDFYFVADTSAIDGHTTHSDRLGDVEVRDLSVSNFLLSSNWTPKSGESPTETTNREKINDNSTVVGVLGDTNAQDATVLFDQPQYEVGDEVIYTEFSFWGAAEDSSRPMSMQVTPWIGTEAQPSKEIPLPAGTVFQPATHYTVYQAESNPTEDSLESTILNRLKFKLGFAL